MTRDIDSPDYRDSNVGEGMIPPRKSATPKPRAGEHAKGPWRIENHFVVRSQLNVVATMLGSMHIDEANARRIVACVNACEAMDDPDAEIADVMENVRLLRIERDLLIGRERELVEALETILRAEFGFGMLLPASCEITYWGKARALLAKHGR